ncbi:MAG: phenylalanine--tRNA ligase subunit beta [Anaerolineaceae bacterium]|nr:phenylalanine--tRNA ligase subunit beta [Anaerolineaceae bacterium]
MKLPISWLNDYIDILDYDVEELAHLLTMTGLEVNSIQLIGLSMPEGDKHEFKISGLSWPKDKFVVAQIDEVMPHPDADKLTLCRLTDDEGEHIVLTGAPNIYHLKGAGVLETPIKVAYAKFGAEIYDGHQDGWVLMKLKKAKIRGVESFSMVASEKELGISEEHEGIILLPEDAPTGMPLVDYMGDAVFDIEILPNNVRNSCVYGVARELAAFTGRELKPLNLNYEASGASIDGQAAIEITEPELNPRFVLGLLKGAKTVPSPYHVQRRLRLSGIRPINAIVYATNYVLLEMGEPLHAFDYDVLIERANENAPTIITRRAKAGEKLTMLDEIEHTLDSEAILVTDTAGSISLAGVMGGAESEVQDNTTNVLLEGANWNYVNIRKLTKKEHIMTEASYRFSRDIHPSLSLDGVKLCLRRMQEWAGGEIAQGLIDNYPLPYEDTVNTLTVEYVKKRTGILEITAEEIASLLKRLDFECSIEGDTITAKTPPYRKDIGTGVVGKADLLEEITRLYGYNNIPHTRLADTLPPQKPNFVFEMRNRVEDMLVSLGLQQTISYRMTSPADEARALPQQEALDDSNYVVLANPSSPEWTVLRRSLLHAVLKSVEKNSRVDDRLTLFEIGPVFLPVEGQKLPNEEQRLAIAITGLHERSTWNSHILKDNWMDFYDMKGIIERLMELTVGKVSYEVSDHHSFHPGKCARILFDGIELGVFGELHPLVQEYYDFGRAPVIAAEIQLPKLLQAFAKARGIEAVPTFPPVLEDLAIVVDEDIPASKVEATIYNGNKLVSDVQLFDIFRGEQVGEGKKSLAYKVTYQADHTLTDKEAAKIRKKIIGRLKYELDAKLRE